MLQITSTAEFSKVISQDKIVVVDFMAQWCKPCKAIAPILDDMNTEFGDKIDILKVDVDDEDVEEVCAEYRVSCMPTFIFFKNGKRIHRITGTAVNDIRTCIEKNI